MFCYLNFSWLQKAKRFITMVGTSDQGHGSKTFRRGNQGPRGGMIHSRSEGNIARMGHGNVSMAPSGGAAQGAMSGGMGPLYHQGYRSSLTSSSSGMSSGGSRRSPDAVTMFKTKVMYHSKQDIEQEAQV